MFRDALLESAPSLSTRKSWPMATAFTLEMLLAGAFVLLPLISSGVLPIARLPLPDPARYMPLEAHRTTRVRGGHTTASLPPRQIVQISNSHSLFPTHGPHAPTNLKDDPSGPPIEFPGSGGDPELPFNDNRRVVPAPSPEPQPQRLVISNATEAMLMYKVVPEYPAVARITGVQGEVKLHAIIGTDGTIQSLTVTSGPDMFRDAAIKAVQQWRYRPYLLNGHAIEVETIITVSFHRS
jgi:periplasmic protein TonB